VPTVYTIGHGTRTADGLIDALRAEGVRLLVDIRRFPGSRRSPHLARGPLEAAVTAAGIGYSWRGEELGGRRRGGGGPSRHTAWRVAAFRSYADWMDGPTFRAALERLERDAARTRLALLCAETLWWRCHRRLVADALVSRGHRVLHIMPGGRLQEHPLHAGLRRDEEGRPVYDVVAKEDP
jgi:uncharacterized protein (DUF488 family)